MGLALGAVAGFVASELWAPVTSRLLPRTSTSSDRSMAALVHDAQAALAADPRLGALRIDVLPVSRQRVELHGWVSDRSLRARAHRVACEAVGADAIVNCILVHGEDDDAGPPTLDVVSA
jgi:osmotically-inducible protein OsmY